MMTVVKISVDDDDTEELIEDAQNKFDDVTVEATGRESNELGDMEGVVVEGECETEGVY